MKRRKINFPVKVVIILAIILLAFYLLIGYIWKVLSQSEFFCVNRIIVRNSDLNFDYLKGRNIFNLDLTQESRRVSLSCPDCRKVRFARILPNSLVVDFLRRQPVALIKFYKNFAVDEQGVLLDPANLTVEENSLPVIYGLETKIFSPKVGAKYRRIELSLALAIIDEFKALKVLRGFSLKRIDVASLQNASFFMLMPKQVANYLKPNSALEEFGFQVRIGEGNLKQKMMILGGLIMQARKDWGNIKYIDLRFNEPLIKLNNKL